MNIRVAAASELFALILISGCRFGGSGGRGADLGTDPGTTLVGIHGRLVDKNGSPVVAAKVALSAAVHEPFSDTTGYVPLDTAFSDTEGRYTLHSVPPGIYDILAGGERDPALAAFIPGVTWGDRGSLDLGTDTLYPAGSIRGRAVLENGPGDQPGVCFVPGLPSRSPIGDSGSFSLGGIPKGSWKVVCASPGYSDVTADAGYDEGDPVELPPLALSVDSALPPPQPVGLAVSWDSSTWTWRLEWKAVHVADLAGYVVYHNLQHQGFTELKRTTDTVLSWTEEWATKDYSIGNPQELEYKVKAIDKDSVLSVSYSASVSVPANWWQAFPPGVEMARSLDSAPPGEPFQCTVRFSRGYRPLAHLRWIVRKFEWNDPKATPGKDSTVLWTKVARESDLTVEEGADTLEIKLDEEGEYWIESEVSDIAGIKRSGYVRARITNPRPNLTLVSDKRGRTEFDVGDTLGLTAVYPLEAAEPGSPWFSRIVLLEWDLGTGVYAKRDSPETTLVFDESMAGPMILRVRVTDEKGLTASDSLAIAIHGKAIDSYTRMPGPLPFNFDPDTTEVVSLGGRIFVLGAASAGLGGKGGWSSVNGESWSRLESNLDFDGPVSAFVFKDRMWVPKGDGFRVSSDGVVWDSIPSQFPAPAAYAEAGRIFGVMGDRMMMIETRPAGLGRPTVVEPYPVWSTPDGTHWEKVQADLPFDPTSGEIFEHQNHMVFVGFGYADSRIIYNMIWYSDNQGKNWENAAETYMIPLRMPGEVISYRGDLWEMGWEQVERSSMGVTGTWGKMAGIDGKAVRSQTVVHSGRVFVFRTGEIWVGD